MTGIVAQNVGRTSGLIKAASGGGGVWTLIKEITASSDSDISFVDGSDDVTLDSTYPIYVFKFINMHTSRDETRFDMNMSIDGGSNYNVTKTTTYVRADQREDGGPYHLTYDTARDLAQGTDYQSLGQDLAADEDDSSMSGSMWLFNPSDTTYIKHFMSNTNLNASDPYSYNTWSAGYANTTSAVDAVQFRMDQRSATNIDSGKIKLYGLKDSA